jgi:hypothetical protein
LLAPSFNGKVVGMFKHLLLKPLGYRLFHFFFFELNEDTGWVQTFVLYRLLRFWKTI